MVTNSVLSKDLGDPKYFRISSSFVVSLRTLFL